LVQPAALQPWALARRPLSVQLVRVLSAWAAWPLVARWRLVPAVRSLAWRLVAQLPLARLAQLVLSAARPVVVAQLLAQPAVLVVSPRSRLSLSLLPQPRAALAWPKRLVLPR
jgi:hypothetical protein